MAKKKQKEVVKKTHSEWSASGSSIWMNCAGQPAEVRKIPPSMREKSSEWANQGTAAHHLLEVCLTEGCDTDEYENRFIYVDDEGHAELMPKRVRSEGPNRFRVDDEMMGAVQVAVDHVREELERLGPDTVMKLEVRCYPLEGYDDMYGTSDVVLIGKHEIVVIDYKHGRVMVVIEGNTQTRYYGLGAAREEGFRHKRVKMTIVQPRGQGAGDPVRSETLTMKEMKAWGKVLQKALEKSMSKNPGLRAGDHCTWCEVASAQRCPEITKSAQDVAKVDFDDDPDDVQVVMPETAEELARILPHLPMLKAMVRHAENATTRILMEGGKIPGYKLVAKKSNRRMTKSIPERTLVRRLRVYGVDPDNAFDKKLKSPAQLEKLVDKRKRRRFLEEFVEKPQGTPTYAPDSDARPPLDPNAAARLDFEDDLE